MNAVTQDEKILVTNTKELAGYPGKSYIGQNQYDLTVRCTCGLSALGGKKRCPHFLLWCKRTGTHPYTVSKPKYNPWFGDDYIADPHQNPRYINKPEYLKLFV